MSESFFSNNNLNMRTSRRAWYDSLIDYFGLIKEEEDKIDLIRASLCSDKNFNPKKLFEYIDKRKKNNIALNDLILILQENNIIFKEENLRKFIHNFDKDNDFCLDYNEFTGIIFPRKDKYLQKKFLTSFQYDNYEINYNIIHIFCNLLAEEMKLIDGCNKVVNKIQGFNGFTPYEAFLDIVNGEGVYINENNLAEFLTRNNIEIAEEDAHQLMFRLDKDNDGQISYEEFQDMFLIVQNDINIKKHYNNNNDNINKKINNKNINKIINNSNNYNINGINSNRSKIHINDYNNDDISIHTNNNEDDKKNNTFYKVNNYYNKNEYNNYNKYIDEDIISPIRNERNNNNNKQIKKGHKKNFNNNIKLNYGNNVNPNFLYDSLENSKNPESPIYNSNYNNYNNNIIHKNYSFSNNNNIIKVAKKNKNNYFRNKKKFENQQNLEEKIKKIFQIPEDRKTNTPLKKNEENKEKENNSKSRDISHNKTQLHYDYLYNQNTEYSNEVTTYSKRYNSSRLSPSSHLNLQQKEVDLIKNNNSRKKKDKSQNKESLKKKDIRLKIPYSSKKKENNNNLLSNDNNVNNINNNKNYSKRGNDNYNSNNSKNNNKDNNFSSNKKIINNLFKNNYSFNNYQNNGDYFDEETNNDIKNKDINFKKLKKEISLQDLILNSPFPEKINENKSNEINDIKNQNRKEKKLNEYANINKKNNNNNSYLSNQDYTNKSENSNYYIKINDENYNNNCLNIFAQNSYYQTQTNFEHNNSNDHPLNNKKDYYLNYNLTNINNKTNDYQTKKEETKNNSNTKKADNYQINNKEINNKNTFNNTNNDNNQQNIEYQYNNNNIKYNKYNNNINRQNQDDIDINNSNNNSSFNSNEYEYSYSQKDFNYLKNNNGKNENENESIYDSAKINNEQALYERYNNLYNLLYDFLKWELIIENIKQSIASQNDVNPKIIFDLFDTKKRNAISISDITKTLKNLGMNVSFDDTKYIFLRNNKKIKEKYKFEEFCEHFLSNDEKKRKEMNERILNDNYIGELSEKTKNMICLLFQKMIEGERSNEFYRNNLAMVPNASGFDLFNLMKKNYSVGISKEDIDHFISSRGKMFYNNETDLIMKKLDRNKDGIIDYTEFLSEITPKFVF